MSRKSWTNEKLFFRLVNNKTDKTYWDNIRELRSRANTNTFNACAKLIKSSKSKERIIAIDILAQLGFSPRPFHKESGKMFFDILRKDKSPKVLLSVLYAIGHNNKKLKSSEIKLLVSFKDNADPGIRGSLVSALLAVDNKLAIDTLIFLTTDPIPDIRDWATFGIGSQIDRNNKSILEALWQRVHDKDKTTKFEAILGLAKRQDTRVKENLIQALLQEEHDTLLFEAIDELKDKDFLPLLKQNLTKAQKEKKNNSEWIEKLHSCISNLTITKT